MSPRDSPAFTFTGLRLTQNMKPGCFSYIGPEVQIQVLMLTRPSLDQLSYLPSTPSSLLYVMGSLDLSFCYQTSPYTSLAEMTLCRIYIIWKLKAGQQWWAGFIDDSFPRENRGHMYILATGLNIFIYHNHSNFMTGTSIPWTVFATTNPVEEFWFPCPPRSQSWWPDVLGSER